MRIVVYRVIKAGQNSAFVARKSLLFLFKWSIGTEV